MKDDVPVIVCVPLGTPSAWGDNKAGKCHECGANVQHRPHVPTPNRLICLDCFTKLDPGDYDAGVTRETVREVIALYRKPTTN